MCNNHNNHHNILQMFEFNAIVFKKSKIPFVTFEEASPDLLQHMWRGRQDGGICVTCLLSFGKVFLFLFLHTIPVLHETGRTRNLNVDREAYYWHIKSWSRPTCIAKTELIKSVRIKGYGIHHFFVSLFLVEKPELGLSYDVFIWPDPLSLIAHTSTHLIIAPPFPSQ